MLRVKTGVRGFDKLVNGGFPENSIVLVSGAPGTGKSIFALHFLMEGAKNGEVGIYVTFDGTEKEILRQAKNLGFELEKYMKKGLVHLVSMWPKNFDDMLSKLMDIEKFKPKRLVIDSITSGLRGHEEAREIIHQVARKLKNMGLTCVITSELVHGQEGFSRDGVSEFIADGLVILEAECVGEDLQRVVRVVKMRETKIDGGRHEMEITEKGIVVK